MDEPSASAADLRHKAMMKRGPVWRATTILLCVGIPVLVALAPLGVEPHAQKALAITSFIIMSCVTQFIDYAIAGLIGCALFWATGIVEPRVAFSGFANDSTWFIFAALMLGLMAARSGLPTRVAKFIVSRVGLSYPRILLGLILTDFALTFIVPTGIGRVVILSSIAVTLIKACNVGDKSNIARGMFLIITYTAVLFDKMIIAGASAIAARGIIVDHGGVEISWGRWFVAFLPCVIATIFIAWGAVLWLYPPEVKSLKGQEARLTELFDEQNKWDSVSIKSALLIAVAILFWVTDFLHGIDPGLVALGVALTATLPFIGVLKVDDIRKMNLLPVLFLGAALSMGAVLRETGALKLLTTTLAGTVQPLLLNEHLAVPTLYWSGFIYHLFIPSEVTMIATSMPTILDLGKTHGFNPLWIGLLWIFSAGGKIFVYQSGVLVVGYSYGYFSHLDMIRLGIVLTVAEFVGVLLTESLWWPLVGIAPM